MMKVQDRYENDSAFRHLVDMLEATINTGNYTPTEVREAAVLAQIRWESVNLRKPIYVSLAEIERLDEWRNR